MVPISIEHGSVHVKKKYKIHNYNASMKYGLDLNFVLDSKMCLSQSNGAFFFSMADSHVT